MKPQLVLPRIAAILLLGLVLFGPTPGRAITVIQTPEAQFVAFEAECIPTFQPGPTNRFANVDEAQNSAGGAIKILGTAQTPAAPDGFATYMIKFRTPGTYYLHYKWKADAALVATDPNTANSFRVPSEFGANPTSFNVSASNGRTLTGGSTTNGISDESVTYIVSQADVDAGVPLVFKIGTRELGMTIDRFVFDNNPSLGLEAFDALANSETDTVIQDANAAFAAFEAEGVRVTFQPGPTNGWTNIVVAGNSGGGAITIVGTAQTPAAPNGFATYMIKFRTPGTYYLHYKWKADAALVATDPNTANSFRVPSEFGANPTTYNVSASNGRTLTGGSTTNGIADEPGTYTVSQADVDAGVPLVFKIGTRELGMTIDRFIFDDNPTLSLDAFNAIPNSGQTAAPGPKIVSAVGSQSLTTVTLTFSEALDVFSVSPGAFTFSGGLTVSSAVLADQATTGRKVVITTTPQVPGSNYTVNVSTDLSAANGTPVAPNTQTNFTAWRLSPGWAMREYYFGVPGSSVADLTASPDYPDNPGQISWSQSFSLNNDPLTDSYGVRLSAVFIPPASGTYQFLMDSDDEAQLFLADGAGGSLQLLMTSPCCSGGFSESLVGTAPFAMVAGQAYPLVALLKQNSGDVHVNVGARLQGSGIPAASVPVLSGSQIAAYSNPDIGKVTITQQPVNTTAIEGHRVTFAVKATVATVGDVAAYQWQVDGANISGAIRRSYTTPPVTPGDSGKQYRCIVGVSGNNTPSAAATLTVVAGAPPTLNPYVGINFQGGAAGILNADPGILRAIDTAGAVPQENFNNVPGITASALALVDASGAASPVTVTFATSATYYTGTGTNEGNDILFQGYLANANASFGVTLGGVPAGNYSVLVYSVGFFFDSSYEQSVGLTGASVNPVFHYTAQNARQYVTAGNVLIRATSTDAGARQTGNYVQFENVSPAGDGTLLIDIGAESTTPGSINQVPALSGIQLVRQTPIGPPLTITPGAGNTVTVAWPVGAAGYTLESTSAFAVSPPSTWSPVGGAPNPIVSAGSVNLNTSGGGNLFLRLRKN